MGGAWPWRVPVRLTNMEVATPSRPAKRPPSHAISSHSKRVRDAGVILGDGGSFSWGAAFGGGGSGSGFGAQEQPLPEHPAAAAAAAAVKRPAAEAVFALQAKKVRATGGAPASARRGAWGTMRTPRSVLAENRRPKRPMNAMELGGGGGAGGSGKRSRGVFRSPCGGGGGGVGADVPLYTQRHVDELCAAEMRAAEDELVRLRAQVEARENEASFLKRAIIAYEQRTKTKDEAMNKLQLCAFGLGARVNALESENYALKAALAQALAPSGGGDPRLVPDPRPPPACH